jgi:hypothetical protein
VCPLSVSNGHSTRLTIIRCVMGLSIYFSWPLAMSPSTKLRTLSGSKCKKRVPSQDGHPFRIEWLPDQDPSTRPSTNSGQAQGKVILSFSILIAFLVYPHHQTRGLPFWHETSVWLGLRVFGLQEMNQIFRNGRGQREDRPWWSGMPSLIDGPDNALKGQLSPQCRACPISNEGYKTMQAWVLLY